MLDHDAAGPLQSRGSLLLADLAGRLRWRFNRLRCMSLAEVGHRLRRAAANRVERFPLSQAVPAPDLGLAPRAWVSVPAHIDAAPYLAAADRIAAGRFDIFALRDVDLGAPPRWNRDPRTGIDAPLSFGKTLDYRDPQRVGDIKYLWEPNRHLHLVTLAQACVLSGDSGHRDGRENKYWDALRQHLESWFDACPHLRGPNWSSALEAGLRLINWSLAWQILGGARARLFDGAAGERFRARWLEGVHQHAEFVRGFFSLHSSANNHLIGEAAGLFVAALTWPHWPCSRAWLSEAQAILEREALLQIGADGVNREQAVAYQRFTLELLLIALLAGRANHVEFPHAYHRRIEAMLEFLASVMDAGGNVPMFGDSDDARVVNLAQPQPPSSARSLLATGAVLFSRGEFKAKAEQLDDQSRWLLGEDAQAAFDTLDHRTARLPVRRDFPEGGYYILGCEFETENEIRLGADAGPLGYRSIAGHGHADALAFTLSVSGLEFLVDSGTYAYHTQARWRRYFRGTAAHNTLRVDGLDQSQPGGNFMWLRKANAGCSLWRSLADEDVFEGWQDGYTRLADPVLHRRRITFDKPARRVLIEDTLQMAGEHDIELFFHFSEACRLVREDEGYAATQLHRTIALRLPQGAGAEERIYHGSVAPIGGWVSRRFDDKAPAPTLAWRARLRGPAVLRTEIRCPMPMPEQGLLELAPGVMCDVRQSLARTIAAARV